MDPPASAALTAFATTSIAAAAVPTALAAALATAALASALASTSVAASPFAAPIATFSTPSLSSGSAARWPPGSASSFPAVPAWVTAARMPAHVSYR